MVGFVSIKVSPVRVGLREWRVSGSVKVSLAGTASKEVSPVGVDLRAMADRSVKVSPVGFELKNGGSRFAGLMFMKWVWQP